MLKASDYKPEDPIFTFVDKTGKNWNIDSERLRQWCAANKDQLKVELTPVNPSIAFSFLAENVIDLEHAKRVALMPSLDPIIYGCFGTFTNGAPDVMMIDGHHRYFVYWARRQWLIPAYLLQPAQWEPFQIEGLADISEDFLRAIPPRGGRRP